MTNEELIEEAKTAREKAIAPYSNFKVGAALLTSDGAVFHGCNVENATFGLTVCAERVALLSALAAGERDFSSIAVVTQTEAPSTPCGACRQLLWEFCGDIEVHLASIHGESRTVTMAELFPQPFDLLPEGS